MVFNLVSFIFSAILELFLEIPHEKSTKKENFMSVFLLDMKESYTYLKDKNRLSFECYYFRDFIICF